MSSHSEWNTGADGDESVSVDAEPLLDLEASTENRSCHDVRVSLAVAVDTTEQRDVDSEATGTAHPRSH